MLLSVCVGCKDSRFQVLGGSKEVAGSQFGWARPREPDNDQRAYYWVVVKELKLSCHNGYT